jgi:hypothetical protein
MKKSPALFAAIIAIILLAASCYQAPRRIPPSPPFRKPAKRRARVAAPESRQQARARFRRFGKPDSRRRARFRRSGSRQQRRARFAASESPTAGAEPASVVRKPAAGAEPETAAPESPTAGAEPASVASESPTASAEPETRPVKLGLAYIISLENSLSAGSENGFAEGDAVLAAVTVDEDGSVVRCVLDLVEAKAYINSSGRIVTRWIRSSLPNSSWERPRPPTTSGAGRR